MTKLNVFGAMLAAWAVGVATAAILIEREQRADAMASIDAQVRYRAAIIEAMGASADCPTFDCWE